MSLRASAVDDPQIQRNLNQIFDELNRLIARIAELEKQVTALSN